MELAAAASTCVQQSPAAPTIAIRGGQKIGQWVDNSATGSWNPIETDDGFHKLQSVKNTSPYLTGASAGAPLTLQNALTDGSQDWELVE